jgi:2-keto-3-deoxy-L-rhamnonate aldolase RhmA
MGVPGGEIMRARGALVVIASAALAAPLFGGSVSGEQTGRHLNPMVDLLIGKKPVFGLAAPTPPRSGRRGGRAGRGAAAEAPATPAPPPPTPLDLAKLTLAHPEADYFFNGGMEGRVDGGLPAFTAYADALVEAGAIAHAPYHHLRAPLSVKTPKISDDPALAIQNISRQLNVGVTSISFVHVDTAQELEQGIAAMRFTSKGGTRPDDVGDAPKYWGVSEAVYREKADVWPLNPNGELVAWAIIETKEGLANIREIAQVKGLGVLIPGAGTLGGVFSTTVDGKRVRDDAAWEGAIQQVLAACKEFNVPCGYPANANDIEMRMKQGFSVFIIQAFNENGFRAVEIGRKAAGR